MKQSAIFLPLLLSLALLQGCHGSSSTNSSNSVRLVNASGNTLDMVLAVANGTSTTTSTNTNTTLASNVSYGGYSGYSTINSGAQTVEILTHGSSSVPLASSSFSYSAGTYYTLFAYNSDGIVYVQPLIENQLAPATNNGGMLRIVDLSADAGNLDIYVAAQCVPSATGITPAVTCNDTYSPSGPSADLAAVSQPYWSNISGTTGYVALSAGTYHIWAVGGIGAPDKTKKDLRFDMPNVVVGDTQVLTLVLTTANGSATTGGSLLDGMILQQQSSGVSTSVVPWKNTYARVRVAANFSDGANASVTANSSNSSTPNNIPFASGVSSPGLSDYALIPVSGVGVSDVVTFTVTPTPGSSSSGTASLTAYGISAPLGTATILPGTDNTLLVAGSSTAQQLYLLADDNTRPQTGGNVKLRLINGVNGNTSGLALIINGETKVSSVAFGTASIPQLLSFSSNSTTLEVNSPTYCGPFSTSLTGGLLANNSTCYLNNIQPVLLGIYTMFVLGNTGTSLPTPYPFGIWHRDH